MLIYVNITNRQTDGQTHQKYGSEPHKIFIYGRYEILSHDFMKILFSILSLTLTESNPILSTKNN